MGGFKGRQIVDWQNLNQLTSLMAPYVIRREARDCLDLPESLPPISLTARLTPKSWRIYKELLDQLFTWLDENVSVSAAQAGVRTIRIAQICSGFIGGLREQSVCECNFDPKCRICDGDGIAVDTPAPRQIGIEKQAILLNFLYTQLLQLRKKIIIWCRFRWEIETLSLAIAKKFPDMPVEQLVGKQKREKRDQALRLLDPRTAPDGPAVLLATAGTGSMGLNLTAASMNIYFSNNYSLKTRLQSEKRIDRPGQVQPTVNVDILAEGPEGQPTIDHVIVKSLRDKNDLATWTVNEWKKVLRRGSE